MHVIKPFINILTDFVASHKIAFYSKLYDIALLETCAHDRTYITLCVQILIKFATTLVFLDKKAPRTTLLRYVDLHVYVELYIHVQNASLIIVNRRPLGLKNIV